MEICTIVLSFLLKINGLQQFCGYRGYIMEKVFKCHLMHKEPLLLEDNRMVTRVCFIDGFGSRSSCKFILDTGAIISLMAKSTAEEFGCKS